MSKIIDITINLSILDFKCEPHFENESKIVL